MLKNKSIDYIFGMITGVAVTITFWACTQNPLNASGDDLSEISGKYQAFTINDGAMLINTQTAQRYYWLENAWNPLGDSIE